MACAWLAVLLAVAGAPEPSEYFQITVVDESTGRGVPLVELRTVNDIRYYTDSAGVVAFYEPGLMDRRVFFHVQSHGYEFPKDGFGMRGRALMVEKGGSAELKVKRINVAERLYRVTGAGVYRDSVLVGDAVPTKHPVLNAQVFGSDSVINAVYHGRIYWFWGDTSRPRYPLGNFHVPGATSLLPADGGLDPEVGVDLDYYVDEEGFAKETARMPGEGPTWLGGLTVLRDADGGARMFAQYVKVRGFLEVYQRGLVEFNDEKKQFEKVAEFDMKEPLYLQGHPFARTVDGVDYVYFATPYPLLRVRAEPEQLMNPAAYEAFTCLKAGSHLEHPELDRDEAGKLRYSWKANTPAVGVTEQAKLIEAGRIEAHEALLQLRDAETGKAVRAHSGSVYWNAYRNRWAMIVLESGGTSPLGEIWYAEADTPLGPWVYARKIVTHEKYSFYNPKQHPMFDKEGGRVIFFEGTYTALFSGNPEHTPRYNYNQIMYKLDLADERLVLPVAVYEGGSSEGPNRLATAERLAQRSDAFRPEQIAFFALDRPKPGCVAVYSAESPSGEALAVGAPLERADETVSPPVFYALPSGLEDPPATTVPLCEFVQVESGRRVYRVDGDWSAPGYRRSQAPVCLVWRNPMRPDEPK